MGLKTSGELREEPGWGEGKTALGVQEKKKKSETWVSDLQK